MMFYATSGDNVGSALYLDDLPLSGGNVSLEEIAQNKPSVYPNTAMDVVMIKAEGVYGWELINIQGAIIAAEANVNGAQEIDLTQFVSGTYFIRLNSAETSEMHKLIVR